MVGDGYHIITNFADIPVGTHFWAGRIHWVKKSSRTAYIFGMPHRWSWFGQFETVYDTRRNNELYSRSIRMNIIYL